MSRSRTVILLLLLIAVALERSGVNAQDGTAEAGAEAGGDMPDFNKMRTKEIKKYLEERGVDCPGCVEKEHFIEAAKGAFSLPILSDDELQERAEAKSGKAAASAPEEKKGGTYQDQEGGKKKYDKEDIQVLMDELKKGGKGFENMKLFTPDDLKNYDLGAFGDKDKDEL